MGKEKEFVDINELAEITGHSKYTIYHKIHKGQIMPSNRVKGKHGTKLLFCKEYAINLPKKRVNAQTKYIKELEEENAMLKKQIERFLTEHQNRKMSIE